VAQEEAPAALTGSAAILAKLRAARGSSAGKAATTSSSDTPAVPTVTFAYASQTGTAQEIARSLAAEWAAKGQKGQAVSLNELGAARVTKDACPVLVVVAASTGDGDPPDNSAVAYVALKKAAAGGAKPAAGVAFTLLGLGDSNYTRFMAVPRGIKNA
jgi:sulfite reductase alpha subunit-like flavoprotein